VKITGALVVALLAISGCSDSPLSPAAKSPLSPAAQFLGTWDGTFQQVSCTTTMSNPRVCEVTLGGSLIGPSGDVTLRLWEEGSGLSGWVKFVSNGYLVVPNCIAANTCSSQQTEQILPVGGSFEQSRLILTGGEAGTVNGYVDYRGTLQDWLTTLTGDGSLEGTTKWIRTTSSKFGDSRTTFVYRLTLTRR